MCVKTTAPHATANISALLIEWSNASYACQRFTIKRETCNSLHSILPIANCRNIINSWASSTKLFICFYRVIARNLLLHNTPFVWRHIDPMLSRESANSGRCYVRPAAWVCAVTSSNNRRDIAATQLVRETHFCSNWRKATHVHKRHTRILVR